MSTTRSLTSRSLGGAAWVISGHGAQAIVQAGALVVLARLLSPTDFGLVGAAMVVVGISQIFSRLGIGPAIVQRSELTDDHIEAGFWLSLLFGLLLAALVAGGAEWISAFFRMDGLVPVVRVSALLFLISGVGSVAAGLLQRDLRFRELSLIRLSSYLVGYVVVGIPLAFLGAGVWALIGANLAQRSTHTCSVLIVRPHTKRLRVKRAAVKDLTYFGAGLTLAQILNYLATQGDNLVVGRWLGAEALGHYGRAYQLMVTPSVLLGQAINVVLFPAMAQVQNEPVRLARAFRLTAMGSMLVMLPVSVVVIVLSPEIVAFLLGPQWDSVVDPFQILGAAIAARAAYMLGDALVRAKGAVYRGALRQGVFAVTAVAGAVIGQNWGLPGVAWGILGAVTLKAVLMLHLSLSLTTVSVGGLLRAFRPGIVVASVALLPSHYCATLLRHAGAAPVVILLVTGAATAAVVAALLRFASPLTLGTDGLELVGELRALGLAALRRRRGA